MATTTAAPHPGTAERKPVTMGRLARRNLRAKPSRFVATMLAVIIGTGFLSTALVLRDSLGSSLESNALVQVQNVDAAVQPQAVAVGRGGGGGSSSASGVPMALLTQVQHGAGVAGAAGILTGRVEVLQPSGAPLRAGSMGRLWIPVASLNPFAVTSGAAPTKAGEIALDERSAEQGHLGVGSAVTLKTTSGRREATVVGLTRLGEDSSAGAAGDVFVSQADAATFLNSGTDQYDAIYVAAAPGAQATVVASVQAVVGPAYRVVDNAQLRADASGGQLAQVTSFIGTGLTVFAYVALFVCILIVYNTFSIIVAQRVREFALLRAIGASAKQIRRSVRVEALVVGVVASAIGLLAGIGFFLLLLEMIPAFKGITGGGGVRLRVNIAAVLQVMILGTLITFVSATLPSFRAGRTPPIAALQTVSIDRSGVSRFRLVVGPVIILAGAASLVLGVIAGLWPFEMLGPVLLFLGVLIGGPRLAVWFTAALGLVVRPLARRVGPLAVENVRRNPNRTATTANALVIGVFLVVFVTAAGGSLRDYVADFAEQFAGPDLTVVAAQGDLPEGLTRSIRAVPGVTATAAIYPVVGSATEMAVGATDFGHLDAIGFESGTGKKLSSLPDDELIVWNILAPQLGVTIGSPLTITMQNGQTLTGTVGALVNPVFASVPAIVMSEKAALAADPDLRASQLAVQVEAGQAQPVQQSIETLTADYTSIEVLPGNAIGQVIKSFLTVLIESVNALLGVAVLIALFGIVNTMILSITERTHEIGMLRAVGMTRGQLRTAVCIESTMVAILGTTIGLVFGLFVAFMVTQPLFEDGSGSFAWPVQELLLIAVLGVVLGLLASIVPAWRASRMDVLAAVRSE